MALFSPLASGVLLVLAVVLGVLSLVAAAYSWSAILSSRSRLDKIDTLEQELRKLRQDVKVLQSNLAGLQLQAAPAAGEPEKERPVWQDFIDDYNSLAISMNVPKAEEACEAFLRAYGLSLLVCVNPAAQEDSGRRTGPKFSEVDQLPTSTLWAWPIPEQAGAYAIVPNPLIPYGANLHNKGGMKETFASNYEQGEYRSIQVRLPALFHQQDHHWKIEQPGVIRLK